MIQPGKLELVTRAPTFHMHVTVSGQRLRSTEQSPFSRPCKFRGRKPKMDHLHHIADEKYAEESTLLVWEEISGQTMMLVAETSETSLIEILPEFQGG